MFCPKCGSILLPKKDGKKTIMACRCGFKQKEAAPLLKENIEKTKKVEVVDKERMESLPLTDATCPECGHKKAHYWTMQTRAGDEPETRFLRCEKCKHTWREYS